jgi:hypothetical protein
MSGGALAKQDSYLDGLTPDYIEALTRRVFAKVDASGDCWEWTRALNDKGYGVAQVGYRAVQAHRLVWNILVGPIPSREPLDHRCRVHHCVNPDHLEVVTIRENALRSPITPYAVKSAMRQCGKGHPFTEANTGLERNGASRRCRQCAKAKEQRRRDRIKAERMAA